MSTNTAFSKVKMSNHNTQLYPICIVGFGLVGRALASLFINNKNFNAEICVLEARKSLDHTPTYTSTGFIQHKSLRLIKKFFATQPPILDTIDTFSFLFPDITGKNKQLKHKTINFKQPIGYMLDLNSFLLKLKNNVLNYKKLQVYTQSYIQDILIGPEHFTLNTTIQDQSIQIKAKHLIVADGAMSHTSKILKNKGLKININNNFSQGAEAIVKIKPAVFQKIQNKVARTVSFGISQQFLGYGMWIAPQKNNILKIGMAIDQKYLLKQKSNLAQLLNNTLSIAQKYLSIQESDMQILTKTFKLIPLVTAAQLYNVTPYKRIWQIGDAGGFVGPLLLDGIYPGLNSTIDTYKAIAQDLNLKTNIPEKQAKKSKLSWQPKESLPGNSIYTQKLLNYIKQSAMLKELYNLIFFNRFFYKLFNWLLYLFGGIGLKILFTLKREKPR